MLEVASLAVPAAAFAAGALLSAFAVARPARARLANALAHVDELQELNGRLALANLHAAPELPPGAASPVATPRSVFEPNFCDPNLPYVDFVADSFAHHEAMLTPAPAAVATSPADPDVLDRLSLASMSWGDLTDRYPSSAN